MAANRRYSVKTQTINQEEIRSNGLVAQRSLIFSNYSLIVLHGQNPIQYRTHCHMSRWDGVQIESHDKLVTLSFLCLAIMIAEFVGGVWANSLSVIVDAMLHCVSFASFMIAVFTIWTSSRQASERFTFGWYRAEVISALMAVVLIWFVLGGLCFVAIRRWIKLQYEIKPNIMMAFSGVAVIVNIFIGLQLRVGNQSIYYLLPVKPQIVPEHYRPRLVVEEENPPNICESQEHMNCPFRNRGTQTGAVQYNRDPKYLVTSDELQDQSSIKKIVCNSIKDAFQSFCVFVASIVIYFRPDWKEVDPALALFCAALVFYATIGIIRDSLLVLMESTPNYLDYNEIMMILMDIPGVVRVHGLRIWALTLNRIACLAHLEIDEGYDPFEILQKANEAIHQQYNFYETTLQIE